jgi:hypothetical protein
MQQLAGPRLSLAMEAAVTLRSLLATCPHNREIAARAGAPALITALLGARNLELAGAAAELLMLLTTPAAGSVRQQHQQHHHHHEGAVVVGVAGLWPQALVPGAVAGLVGLLRRAADHAASMGFGRRRSAGGTLRPSSSLSGGSSGGMTWGGSSGNLRRGCLATGSSDALDLVPIEEEAAEQSLAATVWRPHEQQQQQDDDDHDAFPAGPASAAGVMRHPSLNTDGSCFSGAGVGTHGAAAASNKQLQLLPPHLSVLTSRPRPVTGAISSSCLVCKHKPLSEGCAVCPLSAALAGLSVLLTPDPRLQHLLRDCGCLEVLVTLLAGQMGEDGSDMLLGAAARLLSTAVQGDAAAQDQVRRDNPPPTSPPGSRGATAAPAHASCNSVLLLMTPAPPLRSNSTVHSCHQPCVLCVGAPGRRRQSACQLPFAHHSGSTSVRCSARACCLSDEAYRSARGWQCRKQAVHARGRH